MEHQPAQRTPPPPPARDRLDVVAAKALDSWFPVDPGLLEKVRDGLSDGRYESDRGLLVDDLKRDTSLFLSCLRELLRFAKERGDGGEKDVDVLFDAPMEDFRRVLSRDAESFSEHELSRAGPAQVDLFRTGIVSAVVAEAVAPSLDVDPGTSYCCGLMRLLGRTLVSWNYPLVYADVTAKAGPADDLDVLFSDALGFSPMSLGIAVARQWGLSPALRIGMGDQEAAPRSERDLLVGEALARMCEMGEMFADITMDRDPPPGSGTKWDEALREIESRLGADAFEILKGRVARGCERYARLAPELCQWDVNVERLKLKRLPQTDAEYLGANVYLRHCPRSLRDALTGIYRDREAGEPSRELVIRLVREIMPAAGFDSGCVYLFEPDSRRLVPRLAIGRDARPHFSPVEYRTDPTGLHPVVAAFRAAAPVMEEEERRDGVTSTFVAGVLGEHQRAGVLYLELSERLGRDKFANPVMWFKALRLALCDCLKVR